MCGILASFNSDYSVDNLNKSLRTMYHRGPDNLGFKVFNNNYLGQARLAIIDIDSRSNQPFKSGDYHLVFNGEIYNYKELIKEHDLVVNTESDTEVLIEMYIKYKEKSLDYLNGMFAFCIYNSITKEVFIARDRLGIKPLYYRNIGDQLDISSEIESLLLLKDSDFDDFGLRQYRKLRMCLKGYTIYSDIKTFPPGYYYLNGTFHQYWSFSNDLKDPPNDDHLRELIEDAVSIRKRADVPLGSYLSGGLDSTIITKLLKPDYTWTVGFEEMNEFEWARLANSRSEASHTETLVNREEFIELCREMIIKRKEPLSVPNEVLINIMTKEVKTKNTVVLSGEGADELFWGYDRIFRAFNNASEFSLSLFDKMYCYGSNKDDEVISFAIEGLPGDSPVQQLSYYFQVHHLQGLLRRLDNSTMLNSVEARVPFVDHRLVDVIGGTSFDWRMGDSIKAPLKRLFRNIVPKEIINRKKIGFPVPLESIFSEINKEELPMDAWLNYNLKILQS